MSTITNASNSVQSHPEFLDDGSRGSSVSSEFVNEYDEILKYAMVAPKIRLAGNPLLVGQKPVKPSVSHQDDGSASWTSSTSSSPSSTSLSPSTLPSEQGSKKKKEKRELEIRVIQAKKAIENYKPASSIFGGKKQLQFLEISNAMDTLLETPKDTGNTSTRNNKKTYSDNESPESIVGDLPSPSVDQNLLRMDAAMDDWCLQLKRNVLNELADMKKRQLCNEENAIQQLKSKHNAEILRLTHEVESLKELLYTFEQNLKQKDEVIVNLTNVLNKQKEKSEKIRLFSSWRLKHSEEQRQGFSDKMAEKFYKKILMAKAWTAWRSVVESTWKKRVEKACQVKSQEICLQLTEDYEERLQALQRELASARTDVAKMHTEREFYEENMKKAFMRGVCALNMEAMSMFKEEQPNEDDSANPSGVHYPCVPQPINEGLVTNDTPRLSSAEEVIHPHSSSSHASINSRKSVRFNETTRVNNVDHVTTMNQNTSTSQRNNSATNRKNVNVKMTGKKDFGMLRNISGSQSSAISSIKVERHPKQTTSSQHLIQPQTIPSLACTRSEINGPSSVSNILRKPVNTSVVVD